MSIDKQFSRQSFIEGSERNSIHLPQALEAAIQQELHEVIMARLCEIVARLNAMGHELEEYTPPKPGDISFRDEKASNGTSVCFLRLSVDTIVSVGFKDVAAEDSERA